MCREVSLVRCSSILHHACGLDAILHRVPFMNLSSSSASLLLISVPSKFTMQGYWIALFWASRTTVANDIRRLFWLLLPATTEVGDTRSHSEWSGLTACLQLGKAQHDPQDTYSSTVVSAQAGSCHLLHAILINPAAQHVCSSLRSSCVAISNSSSARSQWQTIQNLLKLQITGRKYRSCNSPKGISFLTKPESLAWVSIFPLEMAAWFCKQLIIRVNFITY